MREPIARVWVGGETFLIYKFPIRGQSIDKALLFRPLTPEEELCFEPMTVDAEIIKSWEATGEATAD